jgi:hypothetical protein
MAPKRSRMETPKKRKARIKTKKRRPRKRRRKRRRTRPRRKLMRTTKWRRTRLKIGKKMEMLTPRLETNVKPRLQKQTRKHKSKKNPRKGRLAVPGRARKSRVRRKLHPKAMEVARQALKA